MTSRMTTAEAAVATLAVNGIDTIFCLPGVQNDFFFDALHRAQDRIRPIHTRHEQGAAYMALGAAMATGRPAAYAVVPGPGFLNTTAALSTAYANNAPVLAVVGQIPLAMIGRGFGMLHEIPDQLAIMRGLTKWAARIHAPHEAPLLVGEAFRHLRSGRPRPVALECPIDVWSRRAPVKLSQEPEAADEVPVDPELVDKAAALLGRAARPLLVVGGGALGASAEVRALAEALQAPVVANRMGRGVLDARNPLSVTMAAGQLLWPETDVVLGIGSRLQGPLQVWGTDPRLTVIRIDADAEEIDRFGKPALGIVGDAASALRALLEALPAHNHARPSRAEEMRAVQEKAEAPLTVLRPQLALLQAIRDALPEDGIFVDELTQIGYVSRIWFPVHHPRTYLSPGYQGTLGWGVATAMGAAVARPGVPVVAITGDGGFMFNVQELASAVQHRIPLVIVLINDGAFGNVQRIQRQSFGNRLIASELRNPDFCRLAESFGVRGLRAHGPEELRPMLGEAIETAMGNSTPVLVEVPSGPMPDPWELIRPRRARAAAQ
jgi:acetolactate synthase I/II/III large subunit